MKKISILLLMIFLTVLLAGCSEEEYIAITDQESDAIAQYCSYLILKHDKNHTYDLKLLEYDELQKVKADREAERIKEENKKHKATPTPTEAPASEDNKSSDVPVPTQEEVTPTPIITVATISEALGITEIDIEFKNCVCTDSYLQPGDYFALNAPEGKKLVVAEFALHNVSGSDYMFDSVKIESKYILYDNEGFAHDPALSLLSSDLQFINQNISKDSTIDSTLVFFVDSEKEPETLKITGKETFLINLNNIAEVDNGN